MQLCDLHVEVLPDFQMLDAVESFVEFRDCSSAVGGGRIFVVF
jgi:hypothetical protein